MSIKTQLKSRQQKYEPEIFCVEISVVVFVKYLERLTQKSVAS